MVVEGDDRVNEAHLLVETGLQQVVRKLECSTQFLEKDNIHD